MAVSGNIKTQVDTRQFRKGINKIKRKLFWFKINLWFRKIINFFSFK